MTTSTTDESAKTVQVPRETLELMAGASARNIITAAEEIGHSMSYNAAERVTDDDKCSAMARALRVRDDVWRSLDTGTELPVASFVAAGRETVDHEVHWIGEMQGSLEEIAVRARLVADLQRGLDAIAPRTEAVPA